MPYIVKSKTTGEVKTVDDAKRAQLISDLGYSDSDFTPALARQDTAPLATIPRVAPPVRETTHVAPEAVSGAAQAVREADLGPGPVRRALQSGYKWTREHVTAPALAGVMTPTVAVMGHIAGEEPRDLGDTYSTLRDQLSNTPLGQFVSDPLNFVPLVGSASKARAFGMGLKDISAAGGLLGRVAEAARTASMPAELAGEVSAGIKAGKRLKLAEEAAQPALSDIARAEEWARQPAATRALDVPPNVTGYGTAKVLEDLGNAKSAVSDLGLAGAAGAKLAKRPAALPYLADKLAAPLHGAGIGAGYSGAEAYLNSDADAGDIGRSMGFGAAGGGLLGSVGKYLRESGVGTNPAINPIVTNKWMTDKARSAIRNSLDEVYGMQRLPMTKRAVGEMAESELSKLSNGPYREAAGTLRGTNADAMRDISPTNTIRGENLAEELNNHMLMTADEMRLGTNKPDIFKPDGAYVKFDNSERARMSHAIDNFVDTKLAAHPNKEQLRTRLQRDLSASSNFDEFQNRAWMNQNSSTSQWLGSNRYQVPLKDLRATMDKQLAEIGGNPESSDYFGKYEGEKYVLPSLVGQRADTKIAELEGLQRNQDISDLARRYQVYDRMDPIAARERAVREIGSTPSEYVDPLLLSDYRTSSTKPLAYKDNSAAEEAAMKAAVENVFRDAANEHLEKFSPYKAALGDARGDYAKWAAWSNLAQHPGQAGLASRIFGFTLDPMLESSLKYKLGNLAQRAIPYVATAVPRVRSTTDTTKKEK